MWPQSVPYTLWMETPQSGGGLLVHQSNLNNLTVFELQAGLSLICGIRANADFRPKGMVVLGVISCSVGYK